MNIIRKNMAPISEVAWKEIEKQTKTVLINSLTARKFVDIDGPHGVEFAAVSTGKFKTPRKEWELGMNYGIREVMPLVEIRKPFELDLYDLDNIERGAKDIDFETLETAANGLADFEENIIYKGLKNAGIVGLEKSSKYPTEQLPNQTNNILKLIGAQINRLQRNAVEGPYSLILEEKYWLELINLTGGYPIIQQLKDLLGGEIIVNDKNDNSYLISKRGGDYELTIGRDTSIGYDSHDTKKLKLYLTESFTFRVLSPESVVVLNWKN